MPVLLSVCTVYTITPVIQFLHRLHHYMVTPDYTITLCTPFTLFRR